jgi:uncharacterized protein (DUF2336 family)
MAPAVSLIPELEDVVRHGSRQKRVETLQRITALFLGGASQYGNEHVALFDAVFARLIGEIEAKARVELSQQLAPLGNAPARALLLLANDDDIAVAGPVLESAPRLDEADLIDLAKTKGQAHLRAISARRVLGEAVTDVLVRRGDRDVARSVAANRGARFSATGFFRLVKRAENDGILAEKVALRPDIPPQMFHELLTQATAVVRRRLLASATPELKLEIRRVLEKVTNDVSARAGARDYRSAQRVVLGLHRAGHMNDTAMAAFAAEGKYDELVVGLAALAKVPIDVAVRLMAAARPDPVLILCKAAGLSWSTVKSIITMRPDGKARSSQVIESAFAGYGRLSESTARRVVRFWQGRPGV